MQNSSTRKISNEILSNQECKNKQINIELLKPRSHSLDKKNLNNKPIKINIGNFNFIINKERINRNDKNIFLNTNRLPKIVQRLSLSNFHKKSNNNNKDLNDLKNDENNNIKSNIFNKTFGFKRITFNKGIPNFRNTNYKINDIKMTNLKPLNSFKDTVRYKLVKEQLLEKIKNNNIDKTNYIQLIENNANNDKNKKKIHFNKNSFNTKTIIKNNNINNPINININLFKKNNKKIKLEKNENNNNIYEENNDSFINEFNNLFSHEKGNNDFHKNKYEKTDDKSINNESDDDKEPDPRINFEEISKVNKSRPQTSYGGLNARRKNLQSALQNKNNRPATSNIP